MPYENHAATALEALPLLPRAAGTGATSTRRSSALSAAWKATASAAGHAPHSALPCVCAASITSLLRAASHPNTCECDRTQKTC